jgi:hypothetical protein
VAIGTGFLEWGHIAPELPHFYRVNVLYPDGWVTVASGSFVSIGGCPKPIALISGASVECIGSDWFDTTFQWTPAGFFETTSPFQWIPAHGDSQWLDLAWSAEDMALGTYQGYGPLSPDTGSYKLRIPTNTPYWWRINTHSAAGWSPTEVWYFGRYSCPLPAPPATPAPPTPDPQAIIAQWNACYNTWEAGYSVEVQIPLLKMTGADTSYAERQFESLRGYLTSYCVGIGARLGAIPLSASCFDMLSYASSISSSMVMYNMISGGHPSYFLAFAKREIDGFLAAARC